MTPVTSPRERAPSASKTRPCCGPAATERPARHASSPGGPARVAVSAKSATEAVRAMPKTRCSHSVMRGVFDLKSSQCDIINAVRSSASHQVFLLASAWASAAASFPEIN